PSRIPLGVASLFFPFGFWALITSRPPAAPAEEFPVASAGSVASASRSVWWLIGGLTVVRMLLVCGSAVAMTFFNVYMDNGLEIPTAQIGIAISLGRLSAVPAALLTPLLAARLGNVQVTALASLGIALFLVPMALLPVWYAAAMGYVGVIALTSVRYPAFMVYTMEIVPAKYRATLTGAGEMAVGLSFAVLAFAGGFIITTGGYGPLFLLGAALNLVGTAALLAFAARLQRTRRYTPVLEQ
nr:hypothetical protein [Caldilineaceae bacterium]